MKPLSAKTPPQAHLYICVRKESMRVAFKFAFQMVEAANFILLLHHHIAQPCCSLKSGDMLTELTVFRNRGGCGCQDSCVRGADQPDEGTHDRGGRQNHHQGLPRACGHGQKGMRGGLDYKQGSVGYDGLSYGNVCTAGRFETARTSLPWVWQISQILSKPY